MPKRISTAECPKPKWHLAHIFWAIVSLLLAPAIAQAAAPAMTVPGQFSVGSTGAATYSVPISAPPGTAGIVPGLSVGYSSQGGDGIIGIGFGLGGLPSITRCPRTLAQDGVHGGVNYDSNDKFCMAGSRLILLPGTGAYGADGSQYRTEIESFSKIIAHGTAGSGPAWLEVHTKSGMIMEFGHTIDSQILVVNASTLTPTSTARAWAVDKVSDVVGNYYTVTYNCTAVSGSCTDVSRTQRGESYPLRIDYTGNANAGVSPYNSVQFAYTTRADTLSTYQAGGVTTPMALLTEIKSYQSTNLVYDYKLSYRAGTSTIHSRLTSITLCDGGATQTCFPATTFGWQGGTGQLSMNSSVSTLAVAQGKQLMIADFNGDGLLDLAPVPASACPPYDIYLGTPTHGLSPTPWGTQITTPVDGASSCTAGAASYAITSPTGLPYIFLPINAVVSGTPTTNGLMIVGYAGNSQYQNNPFTAQSSPGDFNGDGYIDFFQQGNPTSYAYWGNGSGSFTPDGGHSGFNPSITKVVAADFDGDGCTDVMGLQGTGGTDTLIYSCSPAVASVTPPVPATGYNVTVGDFNGDGKTDILLTSTSGAGQLWFSTGTGFVLSSCSIPSGWGNYTISVGNWDGDGKADLLLTPATAGTAQLWVSTGTCFTQAVDSSNNPITLQTQTSSANAVVADWNNDGASDIWMQDPKGGTSPPADKLYTFNYVPELMVSVSNGVGATTNVAYDRINENGAFYTKGSSASFPTIDVDGAMYVVSRIDASNGLGTCMAPNSYTNCYSTQYSYAGAQSDVHGRGFMGFGQIAITDLQTRIVQTTQYATLFPYTGLVTSLTKTYPGNSHALSSVTNTYANNTGCSVTPATGIYFVCLTKTVTAGYDLNDTAQFPTTTTNYTYDSYGNALTVDVSVSDGSSKNTTNTYSNDATNWFLGRLLTTSVNPIVGSSNLTRQSAFTYDPSTGLLTIESIEPGVNTCNSGSDPCTASTAYTYDVFGHRVTAETYGTGITTRMTYSGYDAKGQFQLYGMNALGQGETWIFDARFGNPISHTGPNGLTTTWSYDTFGRTVRETKPDGTHADTSYNYCTNTCPTYGAFYAQSEAFAPNGTTQIGPLATAYFDMLSRGIDSDSQGFDGSKIRTSTLYDANGNVHQSSRPYFVASGTPKYTTYTNDALGRVTKAVMPNAALTTFIFNGLTGSLTNNLGQTTTTTKNAQSLNASVTDAAGKTMSYVYDAFGDLLTTTDPAGNVISLSYDIRGNKYHSVDPDLGTWTYSYDVLAQLGTQTDAKSQSTTLAYDVLGRPLTRSESGLYSTWTYGTSIANHNVGALTDAKACTSSACSTVISERTYNFDSVGRPSALVTQTNGNSFGYRRSYNSVTGALATVTYPDAFVLGYSYNQYGYICQLADTVQNFGCTAAGANTIETVNSRDAELHLTQSTAGNGVITNQSFDPTTGLPTSVRAGTSGGAVASFDYTFDSIGNLVTRTDNNETYTEGFCYDNMNRLTNYAVGATGSSTWGSPDLWGGMVWNAVCGGGTGSKWGSMVWAANAWGACTAPGCKAVSYDSAGLGNIVSKSDVGTYSYPSSGSARPHAISSITGTVDGLTNPLYSYDGNGNLTCVSTGAGCTGTVGRQVSVTSFNMANTVTESGTSVAFTYDDQHSRIKQVATTSGVATTTNYLNDSATGAVAQMVTVGAGTPVWTDYISLDGKIISQRAATFTNVTWGSGAWGSMVWGDSLSASNWGAHNWGAFNWGGSPSVTWGFFVLDHLGSVSVITNSAGSVVQRLSYDAWGKQRNANGTDASCGSITSSTTRGFTNEEQVPVACLVNLNARIYDPTLGKFMAPDPTIPAPFSSQAFNRMAYVNNNPLSFKDPTGLDDTCGGCTDSGDCFYPFCGGSEETGADETFTFNGQTEQTTPTHGTDTDNEDGSETTTAIPNLTPNLIPNSTPVDAADLLYATAFSSGDGSSGGAGGGGAVTAPTVAAAAQQAMYLVDNSQKGINPFTPTSQTRQNSSPPAPPKVEPFLGQSNSGELSSDTGANSFLIIDATGDSFRDPYGLTTDAKSGLTFDKNGVLVIDATGLQGAPTELIVDVLGSIAVPMAAELGSIKVFRFIIQLGNAANPASDAIPEIDAISPPSPPTITEPYNPPVAPPFPTKPLR